MIEINVAQGVGNAPRSLSINQLREYAIIERRWSLDPIVRKTYGELWEAAKNGDLQTLRRRLEEGADVDERGESKMTALAIAVQEGNLEAAEALIAAGANLEARDESSTTPLMRAAWNRKRSLETVQVLIEAGVRLDATDRNGDTAISHAYRGSRGRILQYLVDIEGAPFRAVLKGVSREQVEKRIEELLEGGYL